MQILDIGQRRLGEDATEAEMLETEATARQALELAGRITAAVVIALEDKDALYKLVIDARDAAVPAMQAIITVDPTDTATIMQLQARMRFFTDLCAWINSKIDDGESAAEAIQENFGNEPTDPDD